MNKYLKIVLIITVTLLAFLLRFYRISDNPPALNWDEVSIGYNAYSVLQNGRDEWGKTIPIIFQAYGDYKLPGYIYLLVPFIKIFGLNEMTVRLPSVITGTLTVVFTYLLAKKLLMFTVIKKNDKYDLSLNDYKTELTALLSALLVAIEPWSLFLSRPAFEANLALCFFIIGLYLFFKALYKIHFQPFSILFFGLTVWTYNSYRVFTPLIVVFLILLFKKELLSVIKNKRILFINSLLLFLFFIPLFYQVVTGVGQERYKKVAIIDDGAVGVIIGQRNRSNLNPFIKKLVYNRPTYFVYNFSKNVFSHFTPDFLFLNGGNNYQFSLPGFGLLYKADFIFLILGIVYLLRLKNRLSFLLFAWWIIGTIPSSITHEAPHVLRSITILPVPMIITAIGMGSIYTLLSSNRFKFNISFLVVLIPLISIIYLVLIAKSSSRYFDNYYTKYRTEYSWSWQFGYKEAVNYVKLNYQNYDKIIVSKKYGEAHEFFLFFLKINSNSYNKDSELIRYKQSNWFWVDRFDKFYFVNDWDIPKEEWQPFVLESEKENLDCRDIKCMLITSPGNAPKTWNKINTIKFLDGKTAFDIYSNFTK